MEILIKAVAFSLSKLPVFVLDRICKSLGALMISLPLKRKRVLLSNLVHAFPSWNKAKLKSVARESAARMFEMGLFSIIYPYFDTVRRLRTVVYDPKTTKQLDDLRKNNVPVLFLIPHVSLFETLATSPFFRPNKGKSLGAVYRPNRNPKFDDWIRKARLSMGLKLFSRKAGLKKTLYFLRDGNWLSVLFDQNSGRAGSDAIFLDRLTSFTTFPDLLAKTNNIRVIYALPKRTGFFKSHLVLEEILPSVDKPISIQAHDCLTRDIKNCNRAFPEWLWAHGKWKVHYYPAGRFQLNPKRSYLPKDLPIRTGTRIVIRLSNWLGDVVMSLPIIRALRNARPDMQFLIMGRSIFLPLLMKFELGEEFIKTDHKNLLNYLDKLLDIRNKLPECHLLFTNSLRGDTESLIIGSPQRFGLKFSGKQRPFLTNTLCVKDTEFHSRHLTKTWEQMIRKFGFSENVSYEPFALSSFDSVQRKSFKIGIALGSSNNPAKQWPVNHWVDLVKLIGEHDLGIRVVLFGTRSDFGLSRQILSHVCQNDIDDFVGQTSILQLAEEFSACSLVIGCDSGAVHLASAVGTPTLTIFGPTNHTVTSPCFNNIKRELFSPLPMHSMQDWSPNQVFEQFKDLVASIRNQ